MDDPVRLAKSVELFVLDVDGVLTDGRITYTAGGEELKSFHVRDGSGLAAWRRLGKRAAIITGRSSPAVERRARELGIEPVLQGVADKRASLNEIVRFTGIAPDRIAAVGDDLPDLPVLRAVALPIAVADACLEVRSAAALVTTTAGGQGAVREAIEFVLRAQERWAEVIASY